MLKVTSFYFKLTTLRFLTVSFLVFRSVSHIMPHPTKSLHIHYSCSSSDGHSYFEISKSHWLFATSLWRHPVPTVRHDKYCHRRCKNSKGRYLNSTYSLNVKTCIPPTVIVQFTQYAGQHVYCAASCLLSVSSQWFVQYGRQ
jgi:hypothetical protein